MSANEQLTITPTADGLRLPVKAKPGARKDEIRGIHDGRLVVAVTAAPEKGRANQAIIRLLARQLRIAKSNLVIVSGETASSKTLLVQGATAEQLQALVPRS